MISTVACPNYLIINVTNILRKQIPATSLLQSFIKLLPLLCVASCY